LFNYPVLRARPGAELIRTRQRLDYFARADNTEAFFSFMSGIIVKAQTWRSVPLNEKFIARAGRTSRGYLR
jgi:abequosyltransferase